MPEILVAVAIFAVVVTGVAGFYARSFGDSRKINFQSRIYEDGRYTLQFIANEIKNNMVDYDEYYNQNVVLYGSGFNIDKLGQNYGKYYSAFFNPGGDGALGFDCNDGTRNNRDCVPLRKTLDKNTGENPFVGKYKAGVSNTDSNAFCGDNSPGMGLSSAGNRKGQCISATSVGKQKDLYLISPDATKKTIFAREATDGAAGQTPAYSVSILRMDGKDTNGDSIPDSFACNPDFQCRGSVDVVNGFDIKTADFSCFDGTAKYVAELPRKRSVELDTTNDNCDTKDGGFAKDFVPISPLRTSVTRLDFYITPVENPAYAFSETDKSRQPRVTVILTVAPNPYYSGNSETFTPITFIRTFSPRVSAQVPAPVPAQ